MAKHYYSVWGVEYEGDQRATVSLSRSRRIKDNSYDKKLEEAGVAKKGYITDFRDSYVRFVGKAVNQLKKYDIKDGDRIYADIEISNEPYLDKDGNVAYMKGFRHTVYEFELPDGNEGGEPAKTPRNIDRAPRVKDEEEANPWSTNEEAEDENPF